MESAKESSTIISKKSKALLATVMALCIVGVAVAVLVASHPSARVKGASEGTISERDILQRSHEQGHDERDDRKPVLDTSALKLPKTGQRLKRASQKLLLRETRSIKNSNALGGEDMTSCCSDYSNDTIPAAHIAGHGGKPLEPATSRSSIVRRGYQQKWRCNGYLSRYGFHAFVDGGMVFNQTDKSLQVPVCGYYHIMSQILFKIDDNDPQYPTKVYHSLKFKNNCGGHQPEELAVQGSNMVHGNGAVVTVHTSDVVHLCRGAKVWVEIPGGRNRNPCCPMADEDQTFMAAYLIARTNCAWPRAIGNTMQ